MVEIHGNYKITKHIQSSQLNPVPSDLLPWKETLLVSYAETLNPEFRPVAEAIWSDVSQFFLEEINQALKRNYPKSKYRYQLPPTPKTVAADLGKGTDAGQYISLQHTILVNFNNYLDGLIATVHESVHALSSETDFYYEVEDLNDGKKAVMHKAAQSGFETAKLKDTDSITRGKAVNEGLTQYLCARFVLDSKSPSAKHIRENILLFTKTSPITDTQEPDLQKVHDFLVGKYFKPHSYLEALGIIADLILWDPKLESLFKCAIVYPKAKFHVIQMLRRTYGYELTRDLFRAETSRRSSGDDLREIRHRLMVSHEEKMNSQVQDESPGLPKTLGDLIKRLLKKP